MLAVIFLVLTVRWLLYWPIRRQAITMRQMAALNPQIQALQRKHRTDRERMALEMQRLQKEHGFNPLMGCLPVLVVIPVFMALFHVLRSFNRTGHGWGQPGLSPQVNAVTPNYAFASADVQSFLATRLLDVPLSAFALEPADYAAAFTVSGSVPTSAQISAVALPLMIVATVIAHLNGRAVVMRQRAKQGSVELNPSAMLMDRLAMYVFPLGFVLSGWFLPLAILIYLLTSTVWTSWQARKLGTISVMI
ncbi:membrane protein insertase YidC [Nocardia fluminea]|uniref:membrane protein insertase YidC n=1 Tax=Nocardia fluminea TaxID=134984 RepID=UPI00367251C3